VILAKQTQYGKRLILKRLPSVLLRLNAGIDAGEGVEEGVKAVVVFHSPVAQR
jgi:hypothetical protein